MPQHDNTSLLYHGTVKKSHWRSFLLLSVSPLNFFTKNWALALFAGNEQLFSRLVELLHFTGILAYLFFTSKPKGVTQGIRVLAEIGKRTFEKPSCETSFTLRGSSSGCKRQWNYDIHV